MLQTTSLLAPEKRYFEDMKVPKGRHRTAMA
jgi:hypothetical protein